MLPGTPVGFILESLRVWLVGQWRVEVFLRFHRRALLLKILFGLVLISIINPKKGLHL